MKPVPKPSRSNTRRQGKEKCVSLAKKITRASGRCAHCFQQGQVDAAHIISVGHPNISADLKNLIPLLRECHRYFTDNPDAFVRFINTKYPGRIAELRQKDIGIKPDWDVIYAELKAIEGSL